MKRYIRHIRYELAWHLLMLARKASPKNSKQKEHIVICGLQIACDALEGDD